MLLAAILIHQFTASSLSIKESDTAEQTWQKQTRREFEDNISWLAATPFLSPAGASLYEAYAQAVVSTFHVAEKKPSGEFVDLGAIFASISRKFTSVWLRFGFVLIAFWPIWIVSFLFGYFGFRHRYWGKKTEDILGACDKGLGPFYSGLYGPLRSNGSFSATDHSCPNLACLQMVKPEQALSHKLGQLLKRYGASNQTNIDLARVILRYFDFPSYVEGEQSAEQVSETGEEFEEENVRSAEQGFVSNATGIIEHSAVSGLESALSAHAALVRYVEIAKSKGLTNAQLNTSLSLHHELLNPLLVSLKPEAQLLASLLSPNRAWALGHLPPNMLASAYLATEAGKCLVYKRDGARFARISRYPHLQARAVIQSLVSYGKEYNGDTRLIIRQAIICSRRHGDFGRAFLPDKMTVEGRALRDWLEVLYEEPSKREAVARLVELDAHIEELSINWRFVYSRRIRQDSEDQKSSPKDSVFEQIRYWKGMVYKSVVLVPLKEVVNTALRNIDDLRVRRISELLKLTRRYQTSLSVSTRLPGFKHQALDAQNPVDLLEGSDGQALFDRWVIVRRMLRRYNWLSTRVGDDAVPGHGLVQALVVSPDLETGKPELISFDMLVPIRQRRYDEMFGKQWESLYFIDSPHPANIRVFVEVEQFKQAMKREQDNLKRLAMLNSPSKLASA